MTGIEENKRITFDGRLAGKARVFTRLALAPGDRAETRSKLDETKALIKQTEKPHKPHVPDWEEWKRPAYVGVFKEGDIVGYHRRNAEIEQLERTLS